MVISFAGTQRRTYFCSKLLAHGFTVQVIISEGLKVGVSRLLSCVRGLLALQISTGLPSSVCIHGRKRTEPLFFTAFSQSFLALAIFFVS